MRTREYMLSRLEDYICEQYPPPTYYPKRRSAYMAFMQKSYSRWAANEFLACLRRARGDLFGEASKFIRKMDELSCKGPNKWMFSVAHDVATELLDHMYTF